jgi:hypothetical protein
MSTEQSHDPRLEESREPVIPDYADRASSVPISALAVFALVLSVASTPLVLRWLPYDVTRRVMRALETGLVALAIPSCLSLVVTLFVGQRLRRNRKLQAKGFVAVALTLNVLSIAYYVALSVLFSGDFLR